MFNCFSDEKLLIFLSFVFSVEMVIKNENMNGTSDVKYFLDVFEIKAKLKQVLSELKEDIK